MSKEVFSVLLSSTTKPTELAPYLRRALRIEQGIMSLLQPIVRGNEILLMKRFSAEGVEWLDVHIKEGRQRSLLPELERSLGRDQTDLDIEAASAASRVRQSFTLLTLLQTKHQWSANDFLDLVERQSLARSGRQMGDDVGKLTLRSPDGSFSSTVLPKRGFSCLRSDLVEVQFRPLSVGASEAFVQLSRSSRRTVSGRLRQIKLHLGNETAGGLADQLFQAAKSCTWLWASCRVIDNRDGVAKFLLLESIRAHAV